MTTATALILSAKISTGHYTPEELTEFIHYLQVADATEVSRILDAYSAALHGQDRPALQVGDDFIERLRQLQPSVAHPREEAIDWRGSRVVPIRAAWQWIAAAVLLFAVSTLSYYFFFHRPVTAPEIAVTPVLNDVKAPATNRAMITLANGSILYLDSAANGQLTTQGKTSITKSGDGQISYNGDAQMNTEVLYNTLSNPRGSQVVHLTLGDGTTVWLNAASSIRYPVTFAGDERNVEMDGEAYFEVAHDVRRPFTVSKGTTSVQVLGTHFNVNAYDDESLVKVTLLEGSVKVAASGASKIIRPGDQAQVKETGIELFTGVDTEEVMAWKNGRFQFDGASVEEVMKQVARWYDVEVQYQGKPKEQHFAGGISRNVNVSSVFKMLESTGTMHFNIEGKKVTVLP